MLKYPKVLAIATLITLTLAGCGQRNDHLAPKGVPVQPLKVAKSETEGFQVEPDQMNVKEPEVSGELMPHTVGSIWTYREATGEQTNLVELKSEASKKPDEFVIATSRNGEVVLKETYKASSTGVTRTAAGLTGDGIIDPPMTVIKLPLDPKVTWNWDGQIKYADGASKGKAVISMKDLEPVETPAGTFKAYRFTQEFTLESGGAEQKATNIQWMAPGIGMVKSETRAGTTNIKVVLTGFSLKK